MPTELATDDLPLNGPRSNSPASGSNHVAAEEQHSSMILSHHQTAALSAA